MKTLKIFFVVLFSILLIGSVSAATVYSEWNDGSTEKIMDDGNSAAFSVSAFSAQYSSMTIDIRLYDSQNNLIHAYSNNQVISNSPCKDSDGNPVSGTTCFYKDHSLTENIYENAGDYSIVSIVSDGAGSQTSTITLQVNEVMVPSNNAPQITSSPVTQVDEGESYSYQVTANDADGDSLSYSLTESPSWLSINSNTGLISGTAPEVNSDTDYNVKVRVSDGEDTDSQSYTVTVNDTPPENNAPVAQDSNITTDFETSETITLQATDSDGDSLTFEIVSNPNNGVLSGFDSSTGQVTYTPNNGFSGSDSFTFRANDGQADSNTATVSITVNPDDTPPENNAPVINSTPVISVKEGHPYSYQVTATDADGDTLTFSLTEAPGFLSIDSNTGLISGTAPSVSSDTKFYVTVKVSDGEDTDSQSYVLTVKDKHTDSDGKEDDDDSAGKERHLILGTDDDSEEEPITGTHIGPSEEPKAKNFEKTAEKALIWLVMLTLLALIGIIAIYLTRRMSNGY